MTAITVNLAPIVHLSDEQFYRLCQANRDISFREKLRVALGYCTTS